MVNYTSNSKFEKWMERCGLSVGTFALLLTVMMLLGCSESVPVTDYSTDKSSPSRFKVVSSECYHMNSPLPIMSLTLITDTQGTNEILIVSDGRGLAMMYVPKPVKQLEDSGKSGK